MVEVTHMFLQCMVYQLQSHFMQNCNQGHSLIFKVRQGCHLFATVDKPCPRHKMGKNLVKLQPSSHCHSRMLPRPNMLFVDGTHSQT